MKWLLTPKPAAAGRAGGEDGGCGLWHWDKDGAQRGSSCFQTAARWHRQTGGGRGESKGAHPNLLSRDISNPKICIKHFKQAQESSHCGTKSSANASGTTVCAGRAPQFSGTKGTEKQRFLHRAAAGADVSVQTTVSRGAEPDPAPPGLQADKSCRLWHRCSLPCSRTQPEKKRCCPSPRPPNRWVTPCLRGHPAGSTRHAKCLGKYAMQRGRDADGSCRHWESQARVQAKRGNEVLA